MRHSKSKCLSILMILSLSAGLLCGCGASNEKSTASGEQTTEQAAEAAETKEEGTDYSTGTPWMDTNLEGVVTKAWLCYRT